jgi:hypothetical protein
LGLGAKSIPLPVPAEVALIKKEPHDSIAPQIALLHLDIYKAFVGFVSCKTSSCAVDNRNRPFVCLCPSSILESFVRAHYCQNSSAVTHAVYVPKELCQSSSKQKQPRLGVEFMGYTVIKRIGFGGFGVVFSATHESCADVVSLKVDTEKYFVMYEVDVHNMVYAVRVYIKVYLTAYTRSALLFPRVPHYCNSTPSTSFSRGS